MLFDEFCLMKSLDECHTLATVGLTPGHDPEKVKELFQFFKVVLHKLISGYLAYSSHNIKTLQLVKADRCHILHVAV